MIESAENTMTRNEIMGRLESLPFIDIFEVTDRQAVAYDLHTETDFTIRFAESFTKEDLRALIHISPDIPAVMKMNVDMLTGYLWNVMDHNAFLTLNGLWYVYGDEDYRAIAQHHGCDEAIILPEHDAKGCMWFARQVCIVDVRRIEAYFVRKNPNYPETSSFNAIDYLRREIMVTTFHELRHLMLDTNPALPVEDYPLEWGTEAMVERYAQEICEDGWVVGVFKERKNIYDRNEKSFARGGFSAGKGLPAGAPFGESQSAAPTARWKLAGGHPGNCR